MNNLKQLTNNYKFILASSSKTRIEYLRKFIKTFIIEEHSINEDTYKKQFLEPSELADILAKHKALSLKNKYPDDIIIGSDQVLYCDKVIINKPKTLSMAKENLLFLRNKIHMLYSSIYVIKRGKQFFNHLKVAKIFFNNIPDPVLDKYISQNKETVLSTVGSYKIEENDKFNFVKILSGDVETILGFPLKDLMSKINQDG
tara:strand:+ start:534 stop:1136 length:603 start_codon:yes stop_codon:yes gene_type:complete